MITQADYGVPVALAVRYASTWAHTRYLNAKYDFDGTTAEQAFTEVTAALDGEPLADMRVWPNSVYVAPRNTVQARVKAAYVMARVSRYLGNPGLARLAEQTFKAAKDRGNDKHKAAIKRVYAQGAAAIAAVAGSRVEDPLVVRAIHLLGGPNARGKAPRDLDKQIDAVQGRQVSPHDAGVQEVLAVINAPGKYGKAAYNKAKRKLAMLKRKKRRASLRYQQIGYTVGAVAGVGVLLWVFSKFNAPPSS